MAENSGFLQRGRGGTFTVDPATFTDPFGDARITAIADMTLNLALEVFELRVQVAALKGPQVERSGAPAADAALDRDAMAEEFVSRLLAPFTQGASR